MMPCSGRTRLLHRAAKAASFHPMQQAAILSLSFAVSPAGTLLALVLGLLLLRPARR